MMSFQINPFKGMAIALAAIVVPFYFFASCTGDEKETIEVTFDPETSYTLKETNIETLVWDSGGLRVKVKTDTRLMFDKASDPYWYFPDAAYLEKFDTALNVEIKAQADTAHYYQRRGLWQLDKNVDISNMAEGVRIETSQLFWDEKKKIVYSDSFVVITKEDNVNTGIGFQSNEDLSEYKIYNSAADITVEMQRDTSSTHPSSEINSDINEKE